MSRKKLRLDRRARFFLEIQPTVVSFLGEGETIWTETSHKYSRPELLQLAMAASFRCEAQWVDEEWPFAETLLVAA